MTRVLSLFLVICLVSLSVCRHLDDVLSDARTIKTQVTPDTQSAGGDSGSGGDSNTAGTAQRLTGPSNNLNAAVHNPVGNIIKQQRDFPEMLATVQTMSNTHSEDVTPAAILTDDPQTTPKTTPESDDTSLNPTPVQDSKDTPSQIANNGHLPPTQLQDASTASANTDSLATNDNKPLIDANGEKKDYEKNHAQLETAPNSVRTEDSVMSSEMKEKSNVDSDLPYVKLDNVNDAHVDNTPIIRPEMNHIDNSIDEVEKIIDMPPTILPTMSINPKSDVSIENEPSGAPIVSDGRANSNVLNGNTETSSSPDTLDQNIKTANSVPSPENIIQSEEPFNHQSDRSGVKPKVNTNVGPNTPIRTLQRPADTPNVTPDITGTVNNPSPAFNSAVHKNDNNHTPAAAVENPSADNGVNAVTTATAVPIDSGVEADVATIPVNIGVNGDAPVMTVDTIAETDIPAVPIDTGIETTTPSVPRDTVTDTGAPAVPSDVIDSANVNRDPEDVAPLDIFVDDITYQRFPNAMPLAVFKEKIVGQTFKKLYILESSDKKLFQNVRQLEVTYQLEGEELYAEFLFRFIYSRQCTRIEKFKLGKLVQNSDTASFEKGVEDAKTERLVFFSQRPDDYMFLMSCTDEKNSPYACRETYYVTLSSKRDPPNQFPWLDAARELQTEMNLSFEDPRFIFNFVMMPCARA